VTTPTKPSASLWWFMGKPRQYLCDHAKTGDQRTDYFIDRTRGLNRYTLYMAGLGEFNGYFRPAGAVNFSDTIKPLKAQAEAMYQQARAELSKAGAK
jgi:hypothetical protein